MFVLWWISMWTKHVQSHSEWPYLLLLFLLWGGISKVRGSRRWRWLEKRENTQDEEKGEVCCVLEMISIQIIWSFKLKQFLFSSKQTHQKLILFFSRMFWHWNHREKKENIGGKERRKGKVFFFISLKGMDSCCLLSQCFVVDVARSCSVTVVCCVLGVMCLLLLRRKATVEREWERGRDGKTSKWTTEWRTPLTHG